eukprot:9490340-Pyramimonas_sp.AAC.1
MLPRTIHHDRGVALCGAQSPRITMMRDKARGLGPARGKQRRWCRHTGPPHHVANWKKTQQLALDFSNMLSHSATTTGAVCEGC